MRGVAKLWGNHVGFYNCILKKAVGDSSLFGVSGSRHNIGSAMVLGTAPTQSGTKTCANYFEVKVGVRVWAVNQGTFMGQLTFSY